MKAITMYRYLYTYVDDGNIFRWTEWTTEDWDFAKFRIGGMGYPKLIDTDVMVTRI